MPNRLPQEEFIRRSIEINGQDHYDYSKVVYKNMNTAVIIHCNIHNIDFEQTGNMHLYQQGGCPMCARQATINSKLKGKEYYVNMILEKYGDLYDFSDVMDNVTKIEKILVTCKTCGEKIQTSFESLLLRHCCKTCFPKTKTYDVNNLEDFINYCNHIHNHKYDYSKVEYVNNYTHVLVGCSAHNLEWRVLPNSHMRGNGCRECANEAISKKLRRSFDDYLIMFKNVHGDIFDFSKSEYKGSKEPILVICEKGHEWWVAPQKLVDGAKCSYCLGRHKTREEFIEQSNIENNFKYTYENVVYINNHTKVSVTCPIHGDFLVTPMNHAKKGQPRGCPACSRSRGELAVLKVLQNLNCKFKPQFWFHDCRNINPLPFDFAVLNEDESVKCLLEFQGSQHFEYVCFGGISKERAEENLKVVQMRDLIKKEYCQKNGIPLLCIHYSDINNIPKILLQFMRSLDDLLEAL